MKLSKKTTEQLSLAGGILGALAFLITQLGSTWGFSPVALQISQTLLAVAGVIEMYFLGHTTKKMIDKESLDGKEK